MKSYPSITKEVRSDIYVHAFDKKDGSMFRSVWSRKQGFYKFGTKKCLIDHSTKPFGEAIQLFRDKYESDLAMVFKEQRWDEVTCFSEFFGPNSFAGNHQEESHDVILFDVDVYKQGLLEPSQFRKLFGHLDIPNVVFEGHVNLTLINQIINSEIEGISFEGVVCKGKNDKKTKQPIMFKIKTQTWLDKLKTFCKDDTKLFESLA